MKKCQNDEKLLINHLEGVRPVAELKKGTRENGVQLKKGLKEGGGILREKERGHKSGSEGK